MAFKWRGCVALAVLATVAGTLSAQGRRDAPGATATKIAEGGRVFAKWCAPCHADSPRLAGTLALKNKYEGKLPAALEKRTDLTPEIVGYFVRNGVAWMAPFRKTEVSDAELAALGAYLSPPPDKRAGRANAAR